MTLASEFFEELPSATCCNCGGKTEVANNRGKVIIYRCKDCDASVRVGYFNFVTQEQEVIILTGGQLE